MDELQNFPLRVVQPLVVTLLTAVLNVIGVTIVLPSAGLTLAVTLIFSFGAATLVQFVIAGRAERSIAPLRGMLSDRLLEYVSNLDVLVAYDAVPERAARVESADHRLRVATLARAGRVGATSAILAALATLASVGALWVGIPALGHGLDGPALTVLALVPHVVFEVVASAPLALGAFRQVRASASRVANATPASLPVEIPAEAAAAPAGEAAAAWSGTAATYPVLQLSGLGARWPGESDAAFSGLDVVMERGDRIVGLCEQSPHLFDADIRQNLLFAHDSATDDELVAVLARVGLADWVRERGGLSARVGDDGALVSGGQAQRLDLARALLADFPVIVFDEPTANVDPERAAGLMRDIMAADTDERGDYSRPVIVISHLPVPDDLVTQRVRLA